MKKYLLPLLVGAAILVSCGEEKKVAQQAEESLSFRPLASPADSLARYPHLLSHEESGRLWMSWMVQHKPDSASLWLAELNAEKGEWHQPKMLLSGSDLMVNWADYPHLLMQGEEPGVLYLQIADPAQPYAYHVMWKQAGKPAKRLHSDSSATEHGFVSSALLPDGQRGVIWLDGQKYAGAEMSHDSHGHGGEMTLRFRSIAADGSLLSAQELDGRSCDCCNTAMVSTPKGALAFYRNRTEEEIRDIYFARYQEGAWSEPQPLHEDGWEMTACPVNGPAADAVEDQVAVAWYTGAAGKQKVNLRFSQDAGEKWGPVFTADSLQPMGRVGVQLLPNGNALVSWLDTDGQLVVRQVGQQGELGKVQPIADSLSSRKSGFPQLVRLKDKVYMAWTKPGPSTELVVMEGAMVK